MIGAWLLAAALPGMSIDDAVRRVRQGRDDDLARLEIEAERVTDGGLSLDALRLSIEHRSVDQFASPRLDDLGVPLEPWDNLSVALQVPLPTLEDLVGRTAVDATARAEQALLDDKRQQLARDVARDATAMIALRQQAALLTQELQLVTTLVTLQRDRLDHQRIVAADLDDAERDRLKTASDAVDVDDDLASTRRKVIAAVGTDAIDDDLEAVCKRSIASVDVIVGDAIASSPRRAAAQAMQEAVDREDLAWNLGYVPWPSSVRGTFINRDRFSLDDYRLRVDIDLPFLRFLDGTGAGLAVRKRAVAAERTVAEETLRIDVAALHAAARKRQTLVQSMTLPTTPPTATDPAEALEAKIGALEAQRRRHKAVGRCAAAVIELEVVRGR